MHPWRDASMRIVPGAPDSTLAVASMLCNLALVALHVDTRVELAAVRDERIFGTRRVLESTVDPLERFDTGKRLSDMTVDQLHNTLQKQLNALRQRDDNLAASVALLNRSLTAKTAGRSSAPSDQSLQDEITTIWSEIHVIKRNQPQSPDSSLAQEETHTWRRAQSDGGSLHPAALDVHAQNAQIITRAVHRMSDAGDGRRRMQTSCDADELARRAAEINTRCCDEVDEDCSGGYPHTCNEDCADVLLPFWRDCRSALGKSAGQFEGAVALCNVVTTSTPANFAQQMNVVCSGDDASLADAECIPECGMNVHGYILLLNLDGTDLRLTCSLSHGRYSWVGAAMEGGFIGTDIDAFVSSVAGSAPGTYVTSITADARIDTELFVGTQQDVQINGDISLPLWGIGGFRVQGHSASDMSAILTIVSIRVLGALVVDEGGTMRLVSCALNGGTGVHKWDPGAVVAQLDGELDLTRSTITTSLLDSVQMTMTYTAVLRLNNVTLDVQQNSKDGARKMLTCSLDGVDLVSLDGSRWSTDRIVDDCSAAANFSGRDDGDGGAGGDKNSTAVADPVVQVACPADPTGALPAGFVSAYTISGCLEADDCGTYVMANPYQSCDGAPLYLRTSTSGSIYTLMRRQIHGNTNRQWSVFRVSEANCNPFDDPHFNDPHVGERAIWQYEQPGPPDSTTIVDPATANPNVWPSSYTCSPHPPCGLANPGEYINGNILRAPLVITPCAR